MIHGYVWLLCLIVHSDICWAISHAACRGLENKHPQHLLKEAGSNVAPFIQFGVADIQRVEYIRRGLPINSKGHPETCWSIPATPLSQNICRVIVGGSELWIPGESNGQTTIVGNTAFGGCMSIAIHRYGLVLKSTGFDYPGMIDGVSRGHVVIGVPTSHYVDPIYADPDWTRQPACWIMILVLLFSAYVVYLKIWNILCEGRLRDQWAHHQARHNPDRLDMKERMEEKQRPHFAKEF